MQISLKIDCNEIVVCNVKLQFVSTKASPESTFLSVGWNNNYIIDGRLPITGLHTRTIATNKKSELMLMRRATASV